MIEFNLNQEFLDVPYATKLFCHLLETVEWEQKVLVIYGREVKVPRLTAWYGDDRATYKYSGINNSPKPWTKELLELKEKIETETGVIFNSVLINRYRDGNDSVSWHSDDEPELGDKPVIASISLGSTRKFIIRYKTNHTLKQDLNLKAGSLLVMYGDCQRDWEHQVPKTKKQVDDRINLTFRYIHYQ